MLLNYKYKKNKKAEDYLKRLEIAKKVIDLLPKLPHVEKTLQRKSFLKSSLFSARIEGNRLRYKDVRFANKKSKTNNLEKIEVFTEQAEKTINDLKNIKEERLEDTLLPRRREILEIIRDHEMVSFDFIKRRFTKVPNSSLHDDLRKLIKKGLIKKLGSTRGARYAPRQH